MIATLRKGLQFGKPKAFRSAKRDSISQLNRGNTVFCQMPSASAWWLLDHRLGRKERDRMKCSHLVCPSGQDLAVSDNLIRRLRKLKQMISQTSSRYPTAPIRSLETRDCSTIAYSLALLFCLLDVQFMGSSQSRSFSKHFATSLRRIGLCTSMDRQFIEIYQTTMSLSPNRNGKKILEVDSSF